MQRTNETELQKYKWLADRSGKYGKSCHGKKYIPLISEFKYTDSILDVGTGDGRQCLEYKNILFKNIYGCDWVEYGALENPHRKVVNQDILKENGITFFKCHANNIPLPDKSIEVVTSFDFFEHLIEEEIEKVLNEMTRIGKHLMIHTIAPGPSGHRRQALQDKFGDGELHPTQHDSRWWDGKLQKYSSRVYRIQCFYICIL